MTSLTSAYATAAILGFGFGFQGSVSPGPLQTMIISESLSHGVKSSWRAAIVPICSDPIAMVIAIFFVASVPNAFLAAIAFFGAAFLTKLAWSQFKTTADDFNFQKKPRASFKTIWATNILNPNLWIFTFSINALQITDYYREYGFGVATTYLASFFVSISFFNLATAFLASSLRRVFNAKWLVTINRALGVFLLVVAARFCYLGLVKLGLVGGSAPETMEAARRWTTGLFG